MKKHASQDIPEPDFVSKELQFSFKHVQCDGKYGIEKCHSPYWPQLIRELKRYSGISVNSFTQRSNEDARHTVSFSNVHDQKEFDKIAEYFDYAQAWEFGVGEKSLGWRVYGILVERTFMVIWLHTDHELKQSDNRTRRK